MAFKKLKSKENKQTINIFKSKKFNIKSTFIIEEKIIKQIELSIKGKKHHIKSALLCANVVNKSSYFLQVNVKEQDSAENNPIAVKLSGDNFKLDEGTLVFTNITSYKEDNDEVTSCKIDIFDMKLNPKVKDGHILINIDED